MISGSTAAFWICAACVAWVLVGYPLWLALRARHRVGLQPAAFEPTVTVILPVHNGERFLAAKLQCLLESDYPASRLDVLVISDGSIDHSENIAESFRSTNRVRLIKVARGGKAAALTAAFGSATAEILLMTDVRQELEPQCIRSLVGYFHDAAVGVVSGNLKIRSGTSAGEANVGLYRRYESWIRANLSLKDSMLGATGAIYAIRRSLVKPLPNGCILDDVWLPFQAILAGKRAIQCDEAVAWDFPTDLKSEFPRKVRTQAGVYQLLAQEPRLLSPLHNRVWTPFMVLKVGRLLLPHLMLTMLVLGLFLPAPFAALVTLVQLLFYGLAAVDRFVPEGTALKRLTGVIAAFVSLTVAAFCAQAIFFVEPSKLWTTTRVKAS